MQCSSFSDYQTLSLTTFKCSICSNSKVIPNSLPCFRCFILINVPQIIPVMLIENALDSKLYVSYFNPKLNPLGSPVCTLIDINQLSFYGLSTSYFWLILTFQIKEIAEVVTNSRSLILMYDETVHHSHLL